MCIHKINVRNMHANLHVLTECNMTNIEGILMKIRHRWTEHLSHMSDWRLLKQLPFDQLLTSMSVGRPLLRYKDKQRQSEAMLNPLFFVEKQSFMANELTIVLFLIYTKV